jgi:hypothetical protein
MTQMRSGHCVPILMTTTGELRGVRGLAGGRDWITPLLDTVDTASRVQVPGCGMTGRCRTRCSTLS